METHRKKVIKNALPERNNVLLIKALIIVNHSFKMLCH